MTTDHLGMTVLGSDACFALLVTETVGRLAVVIGDRPEIYPVNFVLDGGGIVIRTAAGSKLAAAVLGNGVAFEVDGTIDGEAWSVIVEGRATEIEDMYELVDALNLPLYPWHAGPKHRFLRIEPDEVTGRRFQVVDPDVWPDRARVSER